MNFLRRLYYRLKRIYQWFPLLWNDQDWDAYTIYPILEYKISRIEHCIQNGLAIPDKKTQQSLRVARKLLKRLTRNEYDRKFEEFHAKWGDSLIDSCSFRYTNAHTPELKEQSMRELRECMDRSDKQLKRDRRWMFDIINKYMDMWWD